MTNKLEVTLPNFQGPLDLLLHLIKSQELDIYDIPIAEITKQYLNYLNKMQQLELEIAGEYFIMASTLLKIKSDFLLPQNDFEEQPNVEAIDPRQELVDQLLTYEIYQKAAGYFGHKLEEQPLLLSKETSEIPKEYPKELAPDEIKPQKLADIFAVLVQKIKSEKLTLTKIQPDQFDLNDQINLVTNQLKKQPQFSFFGFIKENEVKSVTHLITIFLAILELSKNQVIKIMQSHLNDDFMISERSI